MKITEGMLMTSGGIKIDSPAGLFTGNAGWLCPFNALTAFSSPSPVMWQAEISSSRSRGMVIVVATSSGRRSSWRRLPEICSSVRLDWSFKARRSGLREVGPKLRPHTDTEELPSCTSHRRVTRLFSSAERQRGGVLQDGLAKMCLCFSVFLCVLLTHCQAVTGLLVALRERREIPGTNFSQDLKHKTRHCNSALMKVIFQHSLCEACFLVSVLTSSLVCRTASSRSCGDSRAPSFCRERRGRRPHFW